MAVGPHQRIVGAARRWPPDSPVDPPTRGLLFDDQRLKPAVRARPAPPPCRRRHCPRSSRSDGAVPLDGHPRLRGETEIDDRPHRWWCWSSGLREPACRTASRRGKPSTDAVSKFEISPSIWSDRRMYSKPLECRPFLLPRQVGEVLGWDRRPSAGRPGAIGSGGRGLSRGKGLRASGVREPDLEQGFLGPRADGSDTTMRCYRWAG